MGLEEKQRRILKITFIKMTLNKHYKMLFVKIWVADTWVFGTSLCFSVFSLYLKEE